MNLHKKIAIIGGGPAGLAAALGAKEAGTDPKDIIILERNATLGGILMQCIHAGFGLHTFGEELTGPEYALKYIERIHKECIDYETEAMVLSVNDDYTLNYISPKSGFVTLSFDAVIIATGCRERTRGALNIPGSRPAGIFNAGTAQRFVNIEGYMPGKKVVILGSGDIGLIMARRMTLEGAKVCAVCELMPYSSGLSRNIVQCLDDFNIPLLLSHTVVKIHGKERVCGVTIAKVNEKMKPIPETEQYIECDTLLLSVGLIPENDVVKSAGIEFDSVTSGAVVDNFRQTTKPGYFACGNTLHVHDLVDYVSEESIIAGAAASKYVNFGIRSSEFINVEATGGVRYTVPQRFCAQNIDDKTKFYFRVSNVFKNVTLKILADGDEIFKKNFIKVTPGEMECISFPENVIERLGKVKKITFTFN